MQDCVSLRESTSDSTPTFLPDLSQVSHDRFTHVCVGIPPQHRQAFDAPGSAGLPMDSTSALRTLQLGSAVEL